jgi:hypothetical protein
MRPRNRPPPGPRGVRPLVSYLYSGGQALVANLDSPCISFRLESFQSNGGGVLLAG